MTNANVILNDWGGVDCRKTCTADKREKCIHFDCFRAHPREVGGAGECYKLKGGEIPDLVYNSSIGAYVSKK